MSPYLIHSVPKLNRTYSLFLALAGQAKMNNFGELAMAAGITTAPLLSSKKNKRAVKTVGVGYKALEVKEGAWRPQSHDQALDLMIVV